METILNYLIPVDNGILWWIFCIGYIALASVVVFNVLASMLLFYFKRKKALREQQKERKGE